LSTGILAKLADSETRWKRTKWHSKCYSNYSRSEATRDTDYRDSTSWL